MTSAVSPMPSTAGRFITDVVTPLKDRVALLPGSRDRHNRPIIFFPATETAVNTDDLKNILQYFHGVTASDCHKNGFLFIIGTKKGTTKQAVKPILRAINDFFPGPIFSVFVIKSDTFLDKFKFSSLSNKYKFDVKEVSSDQLNLVIDACQILREFGGAMQYDHEEWIECRRDIERTIIKVENYLNDCEKCYKIIHKRQNMPNCSLPNYEYDELETLMSEISKMDIDGDVKRIKEQIKGSDEGASLRSPNPDLAAVIPFLSKRVEEIHRYARNLSKGYVDGRRKQDQRKQLQVIDHDIRDFENWLNEKKAGINAKFSYLGTSESECHALVKEHMNLVDNCKNAEVTYKQLIHMGKTMIEISEFRSDIQVFLSGVEDSWNKFMTRLQQRTKLLHAALAFHQKSTEYFTNTEVWRNVINHMSTDLNRPYSDLEGDRKKLEQSRNEMEAIYVNAYEEGNKLAQFMRMCIGSERSEPVDSYKYVLEKVQRLVHTHKELFTSYDKTYSRISMHCMYLSFMLETQEVLKWLDENGEPFLRKKTAIGTNEDEARALMRHADRFRDIASNTFRNAEQLCEVANTLIAGGQYDPAEIQRRNNALRERIEGFRLKLELRRNILRISSMFHIHYGEMLNWYSKLEARACDYEVVPESLSDCEGLRNRLMTESEATEQAFNTVIVESDQLIKLLQEQQKTDKVATEGYIQHIEKLTSTIQAKHSQEIGRWPYYRNCLQAGHRARTYLNDIKETMPDLEKWKDDLEKTHQHHSNAHPRFHEKLYCYHQENVMQVKEVVRENLEQCEKLIAAITLQNLPLHDESNQSIVELLRNESKILYEKEQSLMVLADEVTNNIIMNRDVYQHLRKSHELRKELQLRLSTLVELFRRAPQDIDETEMLRQGFEKLPAVDHYAPLHDELRSIFVQYVDVCKDDGDRKTVMKEADSLLTSVDAYSMRYTESKRLVAYADGYYTSLSIMAPLIKQFVDKGHKDLGDCCLACPSRDVNSLIKYLADMTTKVSEEKEKFVRGSMYTQKLADSFIRSIKRLFNNESGVIRNVESRKEYIKANQVDIIRGMARKRKRIEQCQKAAFIRQTIEGLLDWLTHDSDVREYYSPIPTVQELKVMDKSALENRWTKHKAFRSVVEDKQNRTKQVCQHIESFVKHAVNEFHVQEVQEYAPKVTFQMNAFRTAFENHTRVLLIAVGDTQETATTTSEESGSATGERLSDCTLEDRINQTKDHEAEKKMRKPMQELIDGEKRYLDILKVVVDIYIPEFDKAVRNGTIPEQLRDQRQGLFGNIEELYVFDRVQFYPNLCQYIDNPADVGFAFVNHIQDIRAKYTRYAVNMEHNNEVHHSKEAIEFFKEIHDRRNLYDPGTMIDFKFGSAMICPVQRVMRYKLLLEALIKAAPSGILDILKEAADTIEEITIFVNDSVKLRAFDGYDKHNLENFLMTDEFVVRGPKRVFSREKEYQIFLFNTSLILTKKDESGSKPKYVQREVIMLSDIFIVEHVDGSTNKFGIRKRGAGFVTSSENTMVFKAENERVQKRWVQKLRELTMAIQHDEPKKSTSSINSLPETPSAAGSNRNSRASRDSCEVISQHSTGLISMEEPNAFNNNKSDGGFRLSQWPAEAYNQDAS